MNTANPGNLQPSPASPARQVHEFMIIVTAVIWAVIVIIATPPVKMLMGSVASDQNGRTTETIAMFGPLCVWALAYVVKFIVRPDNDPFLGPLVCGILGCLVCGIQTIFSGGIMRSPLISAIGIVVLLCTSMSDNSGDRRRLYILGCSVVLIVGWISFAQDEALSFPGGDGVTLLKIAAFALIPIVALGLDYAVHRNQLSAVEPRAG